MTKEMETAQKQLAQNEGKLNNPGFLGEASSGCRQGVKQDAEKLRERIAMIQSSMAALQ